MKHFWMMGVVVLGLVSVAGAQTWTRVATFENYTEGQDFKPSFTDPKSGITFRDATDDSKSFCIEYSSSQFGGGNYLSAGGYTSGEGASWTAYFGFTGDLPTPANRVSVDVSYVVGYSTSIMLSGYNSLGELVAQVSGAANEPHNYFTLEITSSLFDITTFQVSVTSSVGTGYDNVSYTTTPEPTVVSLVFLLGGTMLRRRR